MRFVPIVWLVAACNAEPTAFEVVLEHTGEAYAYRDSGTFETPGSTFQIQAGIGHRLSFATSVMATAGRFLAPNGDGVPLYEGRDPVTGDVSDQVFVWDVGDTVEPATGAPNADEWLTVDIAHLQGTSFEVTLTANTPLSAGVYVVHDAEDPLFGQGEADTGMGLVGLANDVGHEPLAAALATQTGITVPLAHPFWVVTSDPDALFAPGIADFGDGLEALAEDGATADLASSWADRAEATSWGFVENPDGTYDGSAVTPGQSYTFTVTARPDDRLHAAWMFAESNDVFIGGPPEGIALVDGEVDGLSYWDAGTEVNQRPAFGPDQPMRQIGPDSGPDEAGAVRPLDDDFDYPAVDDVVRMTIGGR